MRRSNKLTLLILVLLAATMLLLAALPQYRPQLAFYPLANSPQRCWQWLSGHLVHLSPAHLLANLTAAVLLTLIAIRQQQLLQLLPVLLLSMLGVDLGLLLDASVSWYVGLSGALHGLFAWLMLVHNQQRPPPWPYLLAWLLGALKIHFDLQHAHSWLGISTVPQAHLYGFISGSVLALLSYARRGR